MNSPDILIADINGLGYAAMHTPQGALNHNGFPTGGLYGGINSLLTRMAAVPKAMPVVLWDARCHWRLKIHEGYKSGRSDTPEKLVMKSLYNKQVPIMRLLLTLMGVPQVSCPNAEADDLAGCLLRNLDYSWLIEMYTRDTDWLQALDARSVWHSPVHKKLITLEDLAIPERSIRDGAFNSPKEYLMAKALAGDSSDSIEGIEKVGLATACKIMRAHGGDIQNFWDAVDAGSVTPKGVVLERVANQASRELYARNLALMDWARGPALDHTQLALTASKPDFAQARELCKEFGMEKLAGILERRLEPWAKNGWGMALDAVDRALNPHRCQPLRNLREHTFGDSELI